MWCESKESGGGEDVLRNKWWEIKVPEKCDGRKKKKNRGKMLRD